MIVRDKLSAEMIQLSTDSKWEESLQEMINELLDIRPKNPYIFIQKKK